MEGYHKEETYDKVKEASNPPVLLQRPNEWEHRIRFDWNDPKAHDVQGPKLIRDRGYICTECSELVTRKMVGR